MIDTGSKGFIGGTSGETNPFSGGGAQNNARALGSIGRALSQAGAQGLQLAHELQGAKNAKVVAEAQNGWDTSLSDFRAEVMKNPNPESWIGDFDSKAADWKQKALGAEYMPPAVKRRLENDWMKFHGQARNKLMIQASSLMVEQAKGAIGLRMDKAIDGANSDDFAAIVRQGREDGLLSKQEADKILFRGEKEIQARRDAVMIQSDPSAWLDANKKPSDDFGAWQKNQRLAKSFLGERRVSETNQALEAIYDGTARTEKEIKELTPNLGARARQRLLLEAAEVGNDQLRAKLRSPEHQQKVTGEISELLGNYSPTGKAEDIPLLKIQQKLRRLDKGIVKDRFEARLKDIHSDYREGVESRDKEIKTTRDWAFKQIDEHHKAGLFGKKKAEKPSGQSLRSILDDKFLEDKDRLKSFGFTEDQVDEIEEAARKTRKSNLPENTFGRGEEGEKYDGPDPLDLVRLYWSESDSAAEDFPAFERAAFQAIRDGKSATSMIVDPSDLAKVESEQEARNETAMKAYGRAQTQLADWMKGNPDANQKEVQSFIEEMNIDIQAGDTNSDWRPPKPKTRADSASLGDYPVPTKLKSHAAAFENYGSRYGIDPRFLLAISQLETANGTSSAFRNKRNAMGVSNSKGPISFDSVDASIARMARVLANPKGPYGKATTLSEIGRIYAPPGAGNDPHGTNGYWPKGVAKNLRRLGVSDPFSATLVTR